MYIYVAIITTVIMQWKQYHNPFKNNANAIYIIYHAVCAIINCSPVSRYAWSYIHCTLLFIVVLHVNVIEVIILYAFQVLSQDYIYNSRV